MTFIKGTWILQNGAYEDFDFSMIEEWSGVWTPRTTDGYYYYIRVEMDRYDVYSECYISKYTSPTGGSSNYVGEIKTTGHAWNFGTEWQEIDPVALEWLLANCRSKGESKEELIMENKTFITRIKQKFDTYSNWSSESAGNLVLLKGEIAVSYLQSTSSDRGLDKYFIKIGDGETSYKNLPYISTVDSIDVPDWAKQSELPITYTGSGDIVKGATFGTWTVGTQTYSGIIIEKTDTISSLSIQDITASTATIATANVTTLNVGSGVLTNFPVDTSTLPSNALVTKEFVENQIGSDVSGKADKMPNATGDTTKYLSFINPSDGQYKQLIKSNPDIDVNVYVSNGKLTLEREGTSTTVGYDKINTPSISASSGIIGTANISEISNKTTLSSGATIPTTVSLSNDSDVVNKGYVDTQIRNVEAAAVQFKGATATLPSDTGIINGYMYKASATFTIPAEKNAEGTGEIEVQVGDTIIADVSGKPAVVKWWYIETQSDTDTWRPVQVSGSSISSNTINFINGSHTSAQITTNGGVSSITFNHDAVGNTNSTYSASSGQYVSGVKIDEYGHVSGITQGTLPTIPQISVTSSGANISVAKTTSGDSSTFTVSHTKDTTAAQFIASDPGTYLIAVQLDSNGHIISASENILPVASLEIREAPLSGIGIAVISGSNTVSTVAEIRTVSSYNATTNKVVLEQDISNFATKTYVDSTVSSAIGSLDASITASGSATTSQVSVFTKINEVDGKLTSTNSESVLLATVASTGKIEDLVQTNYVIFDCGSSSVTV